MSDNADMLNDIEQRQEKLSDWEIDFISSMVD